MKATVRNAAPEEYEHPLFGKIIYSYTRAQAIEDGVLVDVSEMAKEAGFKWPVAVTAEVWGKIENIPPRLKGIQDIQGRLWDLLQILFWVARRGGTEINFQMIMDRNEGGHRLRWLTLKAVSGPGDNLDPVITVMMPYED